MGEQSDHSGPWEADHLFLEMVERDTFYGLVASLRSKLFRDADFAELYCPDKGRASVAPSLLAKASLLQAHDRVSDADAKARAAGSAYWRGEIGPIGREDPLSPAVGGGTYPGLAVQVPGGPGALRQEGIQLPWPAPTGTCPNMVSPSMEPR